MERESATIDLDVDLDMAHKAAGSAAMGCKTPAMLCLQWQLWGQWSTECDARQNEVWIASTAKIPRD